MGERCRQRAGERLGGKAAGKRVCMGAEFGGQMGVSRERTAGRLPSGRSTGRQWGPVCLLPPLIGKENLSRNSARADLASEPIGCGWSCARVRPQVRVRRRKQTLFLPGPAEGGGLVTRASCEGRLWVGRQLSLPTFLSV